MKSFNRVVWDADNGERELMMEITFKQVVTKEVKYLRANLGVRYWEDAKVNGVVDEDGSLIPLKDGDLWRITVDLETGVILDWPEGVKAETHYKVADAGEYLLLDENKELVISKYNYVPSMLCPLENGYGDYVILSIDETGKIAGWKPKLDYFEEDDE